MKIALFDEINETHVCVALEDALRAQGHGVMATGPIWHGHVFAREEADIARIDAAVDDIISEGCHALFNFRASALAAPQVERLRNAGITTAVWLPDDPVLYGVTYRKVVDGYQHVLHCGPGNVLQFYQQRGHPAGFNFPFWVDTARWAVEWNVDRVSEDLVFLGNLHGPAKKGRYLQLAGAAGKISVYGKCADDPAGILRGELYGVEAMRALLPRFTAGLNMPQNFADYAGTGYDFPGLGGLGGFDLPSRVIQYAAIGLPVISVGPSAASEHFLHALQADTIAAALAHSRHLRSAPHFASELSRQARTDVVDNFSSAARARFLVAVLSGDLSARQLDLHEREFAYRSFSGNNG